jgi:pyruvate dehydrogenase (quinone)
MRTAVGRRGVAVVVIPGDVALQEISAAASVGQAIAIDAPRVTPDERNLGELAKLLNAGRRITLLCGRGCAGAHEPLMQLADTLKSPIVHAFGGKEYVEYDNPFDVGMAGLIGFSSGYHAMLGCDALLMLGTDFPYREFYPTDSKIIQVDLRPENLGRHTRLDLGVVGDVGATISALMPQLTVKADRSHLDQSLARYRKAREGLDDLSTGRPGSKLIHPQYLTKLINDQAPQDAVFTFDVGAPAIWGTRLARRSPAAWRSPSSRGPSSRSSGGGHSF